MSLIRASSAILQGTLYTLGKVSEQHYLWAGSDDPVSQSGLCDQPDLFEYSNRLVVMCQPPFSDMFLTHKDGIWKPDPSLNLVAPTPRVGASLTKVNDRLILLGGGVQYQKSNEVFQFNNQGWEKIPILEMQPELPSFAHHSATLAGEALIIISTEGIFQSELTFKKWSKVSEVGFENGHSATYLNGSEPSIAIVDSSGLHLLNLKDFTVKPQGISGYEVKRTWHGASFYKRDLTIVFGVGAVPNNSELSIHPSTWTASLQLMKLPTVEDTRVWGAGLVITVAVSGVGLILCGVLLFFMALQRQNASKAQNTQEEFDAVYQDNALLSVYPWSSNLVSASSSSSESTLI